MGSLLASVRDAKARHDQLLSSRRGAENGDLKAAKRLRDTATPLALARQPEAAGTAPRLLQATSSPLSSQDQHGEATHKQQAAERRASGTAAGPSSGGAAPPARAPLASGVQPTSFYSSQRLGVDERVLRFLAAVRQQVSAPEAAPPPVWQLFPTQQPAFEFADAHNVAADADGASPRGQRGQGERAQPEERQIAKREVVPTDLRVFSAETGPEGRRRFLVTRYAVLWARYVDMLPQHRHFYEIIREGWPCHLYFDLEYAVGANPGADGGAAVDALLALLGEELQERFGLELQPDWVLELDSSTATKFSRHLIIRIPGAAFATNAHAGALVAALCLRARQRRGDDSRCAALFEGSPSAEALFVDVGVYSRNRAFRLLLSSKAGKDAVLRCTGRLGGAAGLSPQEVFMRSLVCNVPPSARLLRCRELQPQEGAGADPASEHASAAAALRALRAAAVGTTVPGRMGGGSWGGSVIGAGVPYLNYGPLPEQLRPVESFITAVCCKGGVPGRLRSWALLHDCGVLILNTRDNRWCGNVGRQHRSNGVYYVLNLASGSWSQRCYDPDCRGYRSPLTALPPELLGLWQPPAAGAEDEGGAAAQASGASAGAPDAAAAGWDEEVEEEEEQLMLQALEQYEQGRQQHAEQQEQLEQQGEAKQEQNAGVDLAGQQRQLGFGALAHAEWDCERSSSTPVWEKFLDM
eukprot:scaffold28.g7573.t1